MLNTESSKPRQDGKSLLAACLSRGARWTSGLLALLVLVTAGAATVKKKRAVARPEPPLAPKTPSNESGLRSPTLNLEFSTTLFRYRSLKKNRADLPSEREMGQCRTAGELMRAFVGPTKQPHAKVDVLFHGIRYASLTSDSAVRFSALESRPVVSFQPDATWTNVSQIFGLDLTLHTHPLVIQVTDASGGMASADPVLQLSWVGSYSWSADLDDKWEKIALGTFRTLSLLPGANYTREDPFDGGFVNTTGSTDISSLFRKRKKPTPEKVAAPSGKTEPSYLEDTGRQVLEIQGEGLTPGHGLVIRQLQLPGKSEPFECLYLVLSFRPTG